MSNPKDVNNIKPNYLYWERKYMIYDYKRFEKFYDYLILLSCKHRENIAVISSCGCD